MFIEAFSIWQIIANHNCEINAKKRIVRTDLQIKIQKPTKYRLTDDSFCNQPQVNDQMQNVSNYLEILILNWFYIFFARFIKTQNQENATIVYTNSTAVKYHNSAENKLITTFSHFIDDVNADAVKWWTAILTFNQVWYAIIFQRWCAFAYANCFDSIRAWVWSQLNTSHGSLLFLFFAAILFLILWTTLFFSRRVCERHICARD